MNVNEIIIACFEDFDSWNRKKEQSWMVKISDRWEKHTLWEIEILESNTCGELERVVQFLLQLYLNTMTENL